MVGRYKLAAPVSKTGLGSNPRSERYRYLPPMRKNRGDDLWSFKVGDRVYISSCDTSASVVAGAEGIIREDERGDLYVENGIRKDYLKDIDGCYTFVNHLKPSVPQPSHDKDSRIKELEDAIRKHRETTGHNMCWENDEELWTVLKDGIKLDHTPPNWCEFMQNCAAYRASKDK
jgi:hypothetical protein